jgi:hypothetical protein
MTLHLTRSSRLWDTSTPLRKKNETLTVSMEIHKGAIFRSLEDKGNFTYSHADKKYFFFGRTFHGMDRGANCWSV